MPNETFFIKLYDKNGDLIHVLDRKANVDWAYRRLGGCGQCTVTIEDDFDDFDDKLDPLTEIRIFINNELRYSGRLLSKARNMKPGSENIKVVFFGYLSELNEVIVKKTYAGQEISVIVKDIMDNFVTPKNKKTTYDSADIEASTYSVTSLVLNHKVKDAIQLLSGLAGNFEWGVDRNKKLFFKQTDSTQRRVFIIGKDVINFKDLRKDEDVINFVNVFGSDGTTPIVSVPSSLSIAKFGRKELNIFESSISEASDANRLAAVNLKNTTKSQRRIQYTMAKSDIFIETATPLGATALNDKDVREKILYGLNKKYGRNMKYGNLKRDQISDIRYRIDGGGLNIQVSMIRDIPNMGAEQKGVELQIGNLQRR